MKLRRAKKAAVQIFDLDGKLMMTNQLEPKQQVYSIDTHSLPVGVYMLRVT